MSLFNNSSSKTLVNYKGYSLEVQFILDTRAYYKEKQGGRYNTSERHTIHYT